MVINVKKVLKKLNNAILSQYFEFDCGILCNFAAKL